MHRMPHRWLRPWLGVSPGIWRRQTGQCRLRKLPRPRQFARASTRRRPHGQFYVPPAGRWRLRQVSLRGVQPSLRLGPILARHPTWQGAGHARSDAKMKTLPAILLLILGFAAIARAEVSAGWSTNYAAALSEAAKEQQS